jgi:DNA-binding transcriptional regulator YhcF (GntR family)
MKQVLENALADSELVSLAALVLQHSFNSASLYSHFPDLCQAIVKRYSERHNYEQAKQLLEDVLAKEGKVPSPKELAHHLGYKYQTLRRHFPEYCKQITERRDADVRNQRKERLKNQCTKIRDAIQTLHQQGIYPSRPRVGVLLKRKDLIHFMYLEGYEIWKDTLKELGYVEGNNEKRE